MMKPSRTRDERKNPTVYTPEAELRHQLEQQASQKRKQKLYDALKEKQEILDHYANFKLPTGEGDSELSNFLTQKQQELDVLTKQLESQDPEYAMPTKAPDTREIKRKEVFNLVFYDNFFQKDDLSSNQARIVSKGELDREKRLKLREEERMRRLAGIKESAYDNEKPYLAQPLPEIKQSFQPSKNANDDFQIPPYMKQQSAKPVVSDQYYSNNPQNPESNRRGYDRFESLPPITPKTESEKAAIKEALFGNKPSGYDVQDMNTEEKENTPMNRAQQLMREVHENRVKEGIEMPEREQEQIGSRGGTRGTTPKNDNIEKNEGAGGLFNKLGGGGNQGGNLTDAEKKRKYKEELDALVQQKKGNNVRDFERMANREEGERGAPVRQSNAGNVGNLPAIGGKYGADKQALEREERNKKYAEELRQEIAAKEKERERQKQERRVGSAMAANRRNVGDYAHQYQNEVEPRSIQEMDIRRDENRRQSSIGGGGNIQQYQQQQKQVNESEMDKKKKYKEFLDAQVEEKKRIQSAKQGARRENLLPPTTAVARNNFGQQQEQEYETSYEDHRGGVYKAETPKSDIRSENVGAGGGFFLHKAEDEEKKRAEMRNLQKQRMAEELKKQMEEKEEQKRREKQRKAEEDLRERERLEREAEEEKRKIEDEAQKKLQQEKKNREIAAGPPSGEQHQAEPQYIKSTIPEPEEDRGAQYNRLQNIPEQDYNDIPETAPLRDDSDLSRRRREDLGEHHPYLSKQNFYHSGNEAASQRVAFDPNLFPQQAQYYPNLPSGPSYGSYGSVGTGPGMGMAPPPMNMGYPPMHMGYMAPPVMDPQFGGFGVYQEMTNYQNLMQQVMDERLKIERIAMEEQMLLEQYHNKIKEMKLEKMQYERECERIRLMLAGQIPVTSSVFMNKLSDKDNQMEKQLNALNNSYLPTLINLKTIKASYVSNYNKLLEKSQQSLMVPRGFSQNPLQGGGQNQQREFQENMALGDTFKTQSAIEESGMFRQSLPANSNFNNLLSKGDMEQSFLKDLEAYNAMNPQNRGENNYLRPQDNPLFSQHQLQTNASNFSATLPQATEFRPIEGSGLHNIDVIDEGYEMRATPDVQENRMKQRNMETTPQVIYDDKSPFQTHQKQRQEEQSGLKETTDFDSQLRQGLPVDSNLSAFKMSPKMSRRNVDESRGGAEYLSFNRNAIPVVQESERKQEKSEQEFLDAFKQDEIIKPREEALEVKIGEGRSQKSLVLAEDTMDYKQQEEYDDFLQSHDNAIEELRLGLWKSGEKPLRDVIREDDEDKRGTGFRNPQYDREGVSPRQIGSAMSTGGGHAGDKKYRGPKTIDPFAKVMKSEIRTSREKQPEEGMFNYKETEEDRVKEKSYNEVSKISGFIMESAKKGYEGKSMTSERFEPVVMKEEQVRGYAVEEEEDNEAYDDEEEDRIPEKIADDKEEEPEDEEIEEEYEMEFEDYEDMGNTMKSRKGNLKGTTGTENFKKISPEKNKKVSFEQSSEEKAPRVKTADLEALVMEKGNARNEAPAAAGTEGKDDKRSKTILNRLQRLLDDWEEDKDEEQSRIKEIGAKMEEYEKNKKDKDLFKPVGFGGNKGHSNRYSREGGI